MQRRVGFCGSVARSLLAAGLLAVALLGLALAGCGTGAPASPQAPSENTGPPVAHLQGRVSYSGRVQEPYTLIVEILLDPKGQPVTSRPVASPGGEYGFELAGGRTYFVRAWMSPSGDPTVRSVTDLSVWYDPDGDRNPNPLTPAAGETVTGVDLALQDPPSGKVSGKVEYAGSLQFDYGHTIHVVAVPDSNPDLSAPLAHARLGSPGGPYELTVASEDRFRVAAWLDANDSGRYDWPDPIGWYGLDPRDKSSMPWAFYLRKGTPANCDIVLVDAEPLYPSDDWRTLWGPTRAGGRVMALAADPAVSRTLYALLCMDIGPQGDTTNCRVYRSTDSAATWQLVFRPPERPAHSLAAWNGTLFAGGDGLNDWGELILRGLDSGERWTAVFPDTKLPSGGMAFLAMAVNPRDPTTVYAAGYQRDNAADYYGALIYVSQDGGRTWKAALQRPLKGTLHKPDQITTLAVDPTAGERVYAAGMEYRDGLSYGVVYRSDDRGQHWNKVLTSEQACGFTSVLVHPLTPTLVYAGAYARPADSGPGTGCEFAERSLVYRSTDAGKTWELMQDGQGLLLSFQPPATIFAGWWLGENEHHLGQYDAAGWQALSLPPITSTGQLQALLADPWVPGRLYAGFFRGGVWVSEDGGASWEERNEGLRTCIYPEAIVIDPQDGRHLLVAGGSGGGFASVNDGATWTQVITQQCHAFAFDPLDSRRVYAGIGGFDTPTILSSRDGGRSWSAAYTPPTIPGEDSAVSAHIHALAVDPVDSRVVYAAGWEWPRTGGVGVLLKTADQGLHWTRILTTTKRAGWDALQALAIHPLDHNLVFAGGLDEPPGGQSVGVLRRSEDGGQSWQVVYQCDSPVTSIALDPQNVDRLYVANASQLISRSADRGETWDPLSGGKDSGWLLAMDPLDPDDICSVGYTVLVESRDGFRTQRDHGVGFTSYLRGNALALDKRNGQRTIYVGLSGVWLYRPRE